MASVPQRPAGPPSKAAAAEPAGEALSLGLHRKLDLDTVLAVLLRDGVLSQPDALKARADGRSARGKMELHPIALIANQKLLNQKDGKPLSLEVLTQWLAEHAKLPYMKIDPMKIDAGAV